MSADPDERHDGDSFCGLITFTVRTIDERSTILSPFYNVMRKSARLLLTRAWLVTQLSAGEMTYS